MSSARRADPFGVAALAAAGTMAGHELGYLADTGDGIVSHAYFGVLGPIVIVALCAAAWVSAISVLRRDSGRSPSLAALSSIQVALFIVMEVGERIASGSIGSLASVPVFIGLLLQPLVAWAALRLLRAGRRLIEALFAVEPGTFAPEPLPLPRWAPAPPNDTLVGSRLRVRGPPMV